MNHVTFIITFKSTPAALPDFRKLLDSVARDLPAVEGCQGVQILCAIDDPCLFTLVETWDSREAHAAHVQRLIDSGGWNSVVAHLAQAPESRYFQAL